MSDPPDQLTLDQELSLETLDFATWMQSLPTRPFDTSDADD